VRRSNAADQHAIWHADPDGGSPSLAIVGKQEMVGAIDAVRDVAQRIIGRLKQGAAVGGPPLLMATAKDAVIAGEAKTNSAAM
jgi:dienelactone hydrolase